ncbi:MAG: MerR family transcriptional regulator, partial [Chromatiaceae bacterium]|nr:MerR family transcriptional regulator [Chromatiaceae bacterium]
VGEGLLAPRGESPADWRFDGLQVRRIRRALRLSHDLELDWPATAFALDLLDEIDRLRERLQGLELQLAHWD